jgi:hypothetical protein
LDEYQLINKIEDGLTPTYLVVREQLVCGFMDFSLLVLMLFQSTDLRVENDRLFFESDSRTLQDRIRILYGYNLSKGWPWFNNELETAKRRLQKKTGKEHKEQAKRIQLLEKYNESDFRLAISDYIYGNENSPREVYEYLVKNDDLLFDLVPGFISHSDTPLGIHFILSSIEDSEIIRYDVTSLATKIFKKPLSQIENKGNPVSDAQYISVVKGFIYEFLIPDRDLTPKPGEKIIVLTEGSTDSEFLSRSIRVLYPNYQEYFYFMDFKTSSSAGGAGDLVSKVKAFIGAGIKNKITAIFDNDAAAIDALTSLSKVNLPYNIKVIRYPDLDFATKYPVLVEDQVELMDINGIACSIELYCGKDSIGDGESYFPIKLKNILPGINLRQGEITEKRRVQKQFRKKLKKCEKNPDLIGEYDWKGITAVLDEILLSHVDFE